MTTLAHQVEGHCALCRSRCGARFTVQNSRLISVDPLPDHPTGGALCAKGRAAPEIQHHPERLTHPLKRTRPRNDPNPGWEVVSWDEAMTDIVARLSKIKKESGAQSVAFASASPGATALSDSLDWIERLIFAFGSPNFLTGVEICNWQRDYNHAYTLGAGIGMPDYANTDLIILWGFNPGNVWLAQAQALGKARARGARILAIDPAQTRHAQSANLWLPVRPGTDAALALGLSRALISRKQYDQDFVMRWTNAPFLIRDDNLQALTERDLHPESEHNHPLAWHISECRAIPIDTSRALTSSVAHALALQGHFEIQTPTGPIRCQPAWAHYHKAYEPWTPEAVAEFTGITIQQLNEAVDLITEARAISYFSWTGISQHANASQTDRAIAILYALSGCIDAPGGNRQFSRLPSNTINDRSLLPKEQAALALGINERPLGPAAHGWILGADFCHAVTTGQPYKIRALFSFGANLLLSQPNSHEMEKALKELEFQVHCDIFETPTGRHADYLLPVGTPWEREALRVGFEISADAQNTIQLRPAAVPPAPDNQARSDLNIVFDLAQRLDLGSLFFNGDIEKAWNYQLEPLGISTADLRQQAGGKMTLPVEQSYRQYAQTFKDGTVMGFSTPSRRIEIYSPRFAKAGLSPVPCVMPPQDLFTPPNHTAQWPLTLCCAKSGYYCQSQHRSIPSLRLREPTPVARLHPELAASRNLSAGDAFEVFTDKGAARFETALDETLAKDVVVASFGWWQGCNDLGLPEIPALGSGHSNMNAIVGTDVSDPVSGSVPLRSYPCDIRPISEAKGWNGWKELRLSYVSHPAQGVMELALESPHGEDLPNHRCGQYVRIKITLPELGPQERCYSLINAASNTDAKHRNRWHIAIRRNGNDLKSVSNTLHSWFERFPNKKLTLHAQRPAGRFLLPIAPLRPTILIATGIGITPFLSMLKTIARRPNPSLPIAAHPIVLLYGNRNSQQHAYATHIQELALAIPQLEVIDFYSQAETQRLSLRHGRINISDIKEEWIRADARFYMCGSLEMMRGLTNDLKALGVPRHAIFSESFSAPNPPNIHSGPFEIYFARTNKTVIWTGEDRSLLAMGDRLGLPLSGGCRVGQCESCRIHLNAGSVHHFADTDVAAEGDCLACIAIPTSPLTIDA